MSANNLLLLLSAKTQGSWTQFRAAVEELHIAIDKQEVQDDTETNDLPLYHKLRLNLQRLSHAEFRTKGCEDGWRVAPPALAMMTQDNQVNAVLCGARSARLLERLTSAASITTTAQEDAPDRISITSADPSAFLQLAKHLGLHVQEDAPMALLAALPAVNEKRLAIKGELPVGPGWQIDRFSAAHLRWTNASAQEAMTARSGLFRVQRGFQRFYYYCATGAAYEIPVQIGKYLMLRHRRKVLTYDAEHRTLCVPPICRPPLLVERALILCSGTLPTRNNGLLTYDQIPPAVARLAAQLLRQEPA